MRKKLVSLLLLPVFCLQVPAGRAQQGPTPRELGIVIGVLPPGRCNAITDVAGVKVGHATVIRGENIRTGVTAILPHGGNLFLEKVEGAVEVFNGFGKLAGSTQVNELGKIETPVLLTNTLCVARAADALITYMLGLPGMENVFSLNPLVAETNDWWLNDIRARGVLAEDVFAAIEGAAGGPVEQGSVGAGTGIRCLGYKGGIGTASRLVKLGERTFTLGALVQTNFGGTLTVNGVRAGGQLRGESGAPPGGSCIIVLATDAPVEHRNLRRLARRSFAAMARTGADFSNGSGDYAIAFSSHPGLRTSPAGDRLSGPYEPLSNEAMDLLFAACQEAVEEAIISSLTTAATVTGRDGHVAEAIDTKKLKRFLAREGAGSKKP
ncbi:MAG: P1 family peptidase [Candidatus Glassbacteria bacterium]|nr:P1 family peptidase [Candidatus Glassbacteria bacterium]